MVVSGGLPGTLGARWSGWATSSQRRLSAGRKLAIYSEAHLSLVEAKITTMLGGGQIAADICRFATRNPNPLRAVANAVACAYRSGCTRSLLDASPEVARAFADIVTESGIARKAARLNAASWVAGPHFVSPYMSSRGRVALDIVGPGRLDAEMDGEDVVRVLWQEGDKYVLLDAAGWTYFDSKGNETGFEGHTVGVAPVVPFVSFDGGEDWWATTAHDGLAETTITCSYMLARGSYVQQVNSKPQLVISGPLEKTPKGQVLGHPVQPVLLPEGTASVLDLTVDPQRYLSEINSRLALAISEEGLPPGSITMVASNSDWGSITTSVEGPRLAVHRDKQVPWLIAAELQLWPLVADLVRGSVHKHARTIPPGDEVRDMLRVSFPDLSSGDEQLKRIQVMQAGLPYGLSSPVDVPLAARPELTRDEVDETQKANLAAYIERIKPLVERNIPGQAPDAPGHQTIAQQQGREGGIASGETRAANAAQENANP